MRSFSIRAHALALASALCLSAPFSWAAELDPTFGTGGSVQNVFPGVESVAVSDVKPTAGNKVVMAGTASASVLQQWIVARYNEDGTLDNTFGAGGVVMTPLPGIYSYAQAAHPLSNGKLLVAGSTYLENYDFVAARYLPNGDLDPSFGNGGISIVDLGPSGSLHAMAVQSDGKIILAGRSNAQFTLVRLLENGAIDPNFGVGGKVFATTGVSDDGVSAVTVLADGKILAGGLAYNGFGDLCVMRFLSNGTLDTTFGDNGKALAGFGAANGIVWVAGMIVQETGNIHITGTSNQHGKVSTAVFQPGGSLVTGPGYNGRTTVDLGVQTFSAQSRMVRQAFDRFVLVSGCQVGDGALRAVVARLNGAGELDRSFLGIGHTEAIAFTPPLLDSTATAVAMDANQRIVLGGFCSDAEGTPLTVLARFTDTLNPTSPVAALPYTKGGDVPFAGIGVIPYGAKWTGFGSPAVGELGEMAFLGKWTSKIAKSSGASIILDGKPVLTTGSPAHGSEVPDTKFKAFKDPVIDFEGNFACLATLTGPGITSANDTAVVRGNATSYQVVAQEGGSVPGVPDAAFRAFSAVSIQSGLTSFQASLLPGVGGVTAQNDTGGWITDGVNPYIVVREGEVRPELGGGVVKSFTFLKATAGSPGQGRGRLITGKAVTQVTLTDGRQAVVETFGYGGSVLAVSGQNIDLDPDRKLLKINQPSVNLNGVFQLSLGKLASNPAVPAARATGLFYIGGAESTMILKTLDDTPFGDGSVYATFRDPVVSQNDFAYSVLTNIKGGSATAANDQCLLWASSLGRKVVAREGGEVPETEGARYKAISSVGMMGMGYGPLFTATLQKGPGTLPGPGGITSIDDLGLYYTDASGDVHQVVRENQPLCGKIVKTFSVLKATAGTAGSTRNFNYLGRVVLNVNFTDKTTGIVTIDLPLGAMPH